MAWLIKLFYLSNSHHNNSTALISSAHIMEQTSKHTNSQYYNTNYFQAFFSFFQEPFSSKKILISENDESLNALFTWYDYFTIVLLHQICTYNVFNSDKCKQYETTTIHRSLDYKLLIHFKCLPKYTNHLKKMRKLPFSILVCTLVNHRKCKKHSRL